MAADEVPDQLLFGEPEHGRRDAELAIDTLRDKFGPGVVRPARTTPPKTHEGPGTN